MKEPKKYRVWVANTLSKDIFYEDYDTEEEANKAAERYSTSDVYYLISVERIYSNEVGVAEI